MLYKFMYRHKVSTFSCFICNVDSTYWHSTSKVYKSFKKAYEDINSFGSYESYFECIVPYEEPNICRNT